MPHIIWNPSHPSHHGFAVAAPVLVQENHQTPVDVVHLNKEAMTMSGKRGLRVFNNLFLATEEPLENSEESSAARPSLPSGTEKPQPSIPETPSTMSDEDYDWWRRGPMRHRTQGRRQSPAMNQRKCMYHCQVMFSRHGFTRPCGPWIDGGACVAPELELWTV